MKVAEIRIDGFAEYLGIDRNVSVNWKLEGESGNTFQRSYQVLLKKPDGGILTTGKVENSCHQGISLPDASLLSFEKYQIWVVVEDSSGETVESEWISFATGAVDPDGFKGKWIGNGSGKPFYVAKFWESQGMWRALMPRYAAWDSSFSM